MVKLYTTVRYLNQYAYMNYELHIQIAKYNVQ